MARVGVAESDAGLFGYACRGTFFDHDFLELIYVDAAHRQQGVGRALVGAVERARRTYKLFTSTNKSNAAMRAMLARLSYEPSGVIRNLDPGDPELVFVKTFATPAGLEPTPWTSSPFVRPSRRIFPFCQRLYIEGMGTIIAELGLDEARAFQSEIFSQIALILRK